MPEVRLRPRHNPTEASSAELITWTATDNDNTDPEPDPSLLQLDPALINTTECLTSLRLEYFVMSGLWGWFGGGAAQKRKDAPKNVILDLRTNLEMLQKREAHLFRQIEEQEQIARKNVTTNTTGMPRRRPVGSHCEWDADLRLLR